MENWRHVWPVETICRVMRVSPRGYRSWRTRPISQRARTDMSVLAHIREQYSLSLGSYGRPRMTMELKEAGLAIGERRVGRLMKINGIKPVRTRRHKVTTDSHHRLGVAAIGTDNIAAGILLRSDMTVDEVMACYHDHVDHQGLARIAREAALTYGGSLPGTPAKISMDNRWTRSEYNDDRGKVGRNWADIGCRHPKDARNIFEKFESNHTVGFSVNWNKGSHKFAPCF